MFRSRTEPHISSVLISVNSVKGLWIEDFCSGACYHVHTVFLQHCLWVFTDLSAPALGCLHIPAWLPALNRSNWLVKEVGKIRPSLVFIDFIPLTKLSLCYHGGKGAGEKKRKHAYWRRKDLVMIIRVIMSPGVFFWLIIADEQIIDITSIFECV